MKKYTYKLPALFILLFSTLFLFSQEKDNYLTEVWKDVTLGEEIGNSNILCRDFDGDGKQEILFSGSVIGQNYGDYLTVYSYNDGEYKAKWTSDMLFAGDKRIRVVQAADIDHNGIYEIYVVHKDGSVTVFSGKDMSVTGTYQTDINDADQGRIRDIDGDGIQEFILVNIHQKLYIYNLPDFTLKYYTDKYGGNDVEVGDVDGDGNNEIVLPTGYVLDGRTCSVKWQFSNLLRYHVELGDVNNDSIRDIISYIYKNSRINIIAYDAVNKDTIWISPTYYDGCSGLKFFYLYGEPRILFASSSPDYYTNISCYDAVTAQYLWTSDDNIPIVSSIETGDPDNDGEEEYIYGWNADHYYQLNPNNLKVANLENHLEEWKSDGVFTFDCISVDDIDNDDTVEFVVAAIKALDYDFYEGNIFIYNSATHRKTGSITLEGKSFSENSICMKTGNINETPQKEIVVGMDGYLYVYDGKTLQLLWKSYKMDNIKDIEIADVDNDGDTEIVIGGREYYDGHLYIFDGNTFERELSIPYIHYINDIEITDCDTDEAKEIIIATLDKIYVYDGIRHILEKEKDLSKITSLEVCDYNKDGVPDIAAGSSNGYIFFIRSTDFVVTKVLSVFENKPVTDIKLENIDETKSPEIIAGGYSLKIFSTDDYHLIRKITDIGDSHYNISVSDIDNDGYKDLFFRTSWGIFQYESDEHYPDVTPPEIISTEPREGMQNLATNIAVKAKFSELMDQSLINDNTVELFSQDGLPLSKTLSYDDSNNTLTIVPDVYLPENSTITAVFSGNLTDVAENGMDGNGNGVSDGSPADDVTLTFTTSAGTDNTGPEFVSLYADTNSVWHGREIIGYGTVTDSSESLYSPVVLAEYFIDNPGNPGDGIAMIPDDMVYDEVTEEVNSATIAADTLHTGKHTLYFHALDLAGNWGDFTQKEITIASEQPASWSMAGKNTQHTGGNIYDTLYPQLKLRWSKSLGDFEVNPAIVVNNKVIVSAKYLDYPMDGNLYAFDLETGNDLWTVHVNETGYFMPPASGYGYVYVQYYNGDDNTHIRAYDILTGKSGWQKSFTVRSKVPFSPTIADKKIFLSTGRYNSSVVSCDAFNGKSQWFCDLPGYGGSIPAYFDDTLYVFTGYSENTGVLTAIDAKNGTKYYDIQAIPFDNGDTNIVNSYPVIDTANRIIVITSTGYLSAVDMNSQKVLWNNQGDFLNPAVSDGKVYCINNGILEVYDVLTGSELWNYSGDEDFNYPPVISKEYVYLSSENKVYGVNLVSHQKVWSYDAGGYLTLGPECLVIAGSDKKVYVFESLPTDVQNNSVGNNGIVLYQNRPNPVQGSAATTISYYLPNAGHVKIELSGVDGKHYGVLEDKLQDRGKHSVMVNMKDYAPGIYLYKLFVNNKLVSSKKMVVGK